MSERMNDLKPFSFKARWHSFGYAGRGIWTLLCREHNARIHVVALVGVVVAGVCLNLAVGEWLLVVVVSGMVLAAEAFNSAIEALADRMTRDHDPLIGRAKDLAAGGVLLTALAAALVGGWIFVPKFIALW